MNYNISRNVYEQTEVYSTGGGFYTAEYRVGDLVYIIENEYTHCLSLFDGSKDEDELFMPENMIYSIDDTELNYYQTQIYVAMLEKMFDELTK